MALIKSILTLSGEGTPEGGGERYLTQAAWESGDQNKKGAGDSAELECYSGTFVSYCEIAGWDTSAGNEIDIYAAPGHEHNGVWDSGCIWDNTGTLWSTLTIDVSYVNIRDIEFKHTVNYSGQPAVIYRTLGGIGCTLTNILITNDTSGYVSNSANNTTPYLILNNVVGRGANNDLSCYFLNMNTELNYVTALDGGTGFKASFSGSMIYRNCIAYGQNVEGFELSSGGVNASTSNNASGDASAPGTGSQTGITTAAWESYPTDLTPAAGGPLEDNGIAVAGVTVDIANNLRNDPPEIGSFEIAGSGPIDSNLLEGGPFTTTGAALIEEMYVKDGGIWVKYKPYVKDTGAWVETKAYVKEAGVWVQVYGEP